MLAFTFENFTYVNEDFDYSEYRPTEFQILSPDDIKGAALINLRPDVRQEAGLSIGWTILISLILLIGALMFTN